MKKLRLRDFKNFLQISKEHIGTLHEGKSPQKCYKYKIKFTCFVQLYQSDKYALMVESFVTSNAEHKNLIKRVFTERLYQNISNILILHSEDVYTTSFDQMSRTEKNKIINKKQIQHLGYEYLAR